MKEFVLIIVYIFSLYSCNKESVSSKIETLENNDSLNLYCDSLNNSIGIITIDEENFNDSIEILNFDNTVFTTIQKNEEKQIIAFKCISFEANKYSIMFDGKIKYLSSKNQDLKFYNWNQYLLQKVFSIEIDFKVSPLRMEKNGKIIPISKNNNHRISIVAVEKDWIQIKYENFETEKSTLGWIKWRDESCILIELYYFA